MTSLLTYIQERLSTNKDEMLLTPKSKDELVDIILDHFYNGIGNLNDIDVSELNKEAFYRLFYKLKDTIEKTNITEINISNWKLRELYCFNDIGMFEKCNTLETVILPDCLEVIGKYTFYYNDLHNIIIPDSVTSIGDYAFDHCNKLTSLIIPDSVTSIGNLAFNNCHVFLTIMVPNEDVKKLVEKSGFTGKIEIK